MRQFLSTCSDDSKPYMILKDLVESFSNHIEFAIIRAHGKNLCHAKVSVFFAIWVFCVGSRVYLQTGCSHLHQTYTCGEALVETFQNHIGFATIGARGEELWLSE